jgi:hypothetical protein
MGGGGGGKSNNKPVFVDEVVIDLEESPDLYNEIIDQLNNALKIDIQRYENLDLSCCFDKNEEMCEILDKYSGRYSSSSRVDWLKCDPLPDLDFLKDITAEAIGSLNFTSLLVKENHIVDDFFVSIDDLFGEDIIPASPPHPSKALVWEKTPDYLKDFGSPDIFKSARKISSSTPNRTPKAIRSPLQSKKLDPLPEEDVWNAQKISSSTPNRLPAKAILSPLQPKKLDTVPEEEEGDVWNLSDLFEEEEIKTPQDSTLLGVTQLASLIERSRRAKSLPSPIKINDNSVSDERTQDRSVISSPPSEKSTDMELLDLDEIFDQHSPPPSRENETSVLHSKTCKKLDLSPSYSPPSPGNKSEKSLLHNKNRKDLTQSPSSEKSADLEILDLDEIFDKHSPPPSHKNKTSALHNKTCKKLNLSPSCSPPSSGNKSEKSLLHNKICKDLTQSPSSGKSADLEILDLDEIFDKYSHSPSKANEKVSQAKTDVKRLPSPDKDKATAVIETKNCNSSATNHWEKSSDIELLDLDGIFDQIEAPKKTPVGEPQPSTSGVKKNFKKFEGRNKKTSLEKSSYEEVGLCVLDMLPPPPGPLVKKFGLSLKKSRAVKSSELSSVSKPQTFLDGSEKFDFKEPEVIASEYFSQPEEERFIVRPNKKKPVRRIVSSDEDNSSNDEREHHEEEEEILSQNVDRFNLASPVQNTDTSFLSSPPKRKRQDEEDFSHKRRKGVANKNIINLDSDEEDVFESSTVAASLVDQTLITENRKKRKRKNAHKVSVLI